MPRRNREYKKGEPYRDSRLFVIACEGEKREKEYFLFLAKDNQRIKVKVLASEGDHRGKSSPKWVFDRAANFESEFGLNEYDQLWLVIDIDKWSSEEIRTIGQQCTEKAQWNIAISNPCFELWLILHVTNIDPTIEKKCSELKTDLHNSINGGYKVESFMPLINDAVSRASDLESDPSYFLPNLMETKVHHLIIEIQKIK